MSVDLDEVKSALIVADYVQKLPHYASLETINISKRHYRLFIELLKDAEASSQFSSTTGEEHDRNIKI